jgi:hypothetical protein
VGEYRWVFTHVGFFRFRRRGVLATTMAVPGFGNQAQPRDKCELDGNSQGGFTEIVETKLLVRAGDIDRARKLIERRTTDESA